MADNYIQITNEFYELHKEDVRLNPIMANDGFYYVDDNCLNTCPDLFNGSEIVFQKSVEDFPKKEETSF